MGNRESELRCLYRFGVKNSGYDCVGCCSAFNNKSLSGKRFSKLWQNVRRINNNRTDNPKSYTFRAVITCTVRRIGLLTNLFKILVHVSSLRRCAIPTGGGNTMEFLKHGYKEKPFLTFLLQYFFGRNMNVTRHVSRRRI